MKLTKLLWALGLSALIGAGCSSGDNSNPQPVYPTSNLPNGPTLAAVSGSNVMALTINGSNCSANSYPNKPCVSVTICSVNSSACQTINDILLDTGSYGLRLFKSVISGGITLTPTMKGANTVSECVQYGDGSSDWGPVESVNVVLGSEPNTLVPIQVIDSTYSNGTTYCPGTNNGGPDSSPSEAGFNGILGVGIFAQDCGADCETDPGNGTYFSCNGTKCIGTILLSQNQVTNPVTLLPSDNNGVIVELPSIPYGGLSSMNGYIVLGINTESNNVPNGVTAYPADPSAGSFQTVYDSQTYSTSFLDTGSNGLFFTAPTSGVLPDCTDSTGWFCPASTQTFSASSTGYQGTPGITIPFYIGNADSLFNTSNNVFLEVGGDGGGVFDWGLPFHFGRNVYVGVENSSSSLGSGPYWAF